MGSPFSQQDKGNVNSTVNDTENLHPAVNEIGNSNVSENHNRNVTPTVNGTRCDVTMDKTMDHIKDAGSIQNMKNEIGSCKQDTGYCPAKDYGRNRQEDQHSVNGTAHCNGLVEVGENGKTNGNQLSLKKVWTFYNVLLPPSITNQWLRI